MRWSTRRASAARAARRVAPADAPARPADGGRDPHALPVVLRARAATPTTCCASCRSRRSGAPGTRSSRAARSSASPWRARWWAIPSCSSSTSRRPASIRSRACSSGTSSRSSRRAGGRCCSPRTTWTRRSASAIASAIVDHGKLIALGTPRELIASLGRAGGHRADARRGRARRGGGRASCPACTACGASPTGSCSPPTRCTSRCPALVDHLRAAGQHARAPVDAPRHARGRLRRRSPGGRLRD